MTLRGEPYLQWQAVDQHGTELDILLQKRRDKAAAKRLFEHVLASCPEVPRKIVTDQLRRYPAAKAEIPELANVLHVFVKASARLNNRVENSHQPTRERERRMRGFRVPERTQAFLSSFGPIRQHFALKRHLLRASLYCKQLGDRFASWHRLTELTQNPTGARMNLLAIVSRLMNAALGRLTKKAVQLRAERAAGREPDIVATAMMLADLSVPRRHWDPVTSPPAALLRAEFCVVPFTARTRELGDIARWINNEANIALGLISGPGGRGKTRLAMEAAIEVATNGWSSGFVSPKTLTLLLEALPAGGHLLAVVDYAEDDPASLIGALAAANQQAAAKPCTIRILLLARNAGEWFQRLQECGGPVADLIHHPSTFFRLRLAQLAGTEEDSTALMSLARDAFRGALTLPSPAHSSSPVTTSRDALIIFSHALLIELGDETSHADEKAVLEYLLARERGFWHRALSRQNLAEAHWRLFETLVAVVAYAGGAGNLSQIDKLFRTFATNFSIDLATTEAFRLVLTAVYGLGAGIEPLQPDRLGEHLMAHHADPEVIALASFRAAV